jgi:hypothetical protein
LDCGNYNATVYTNQRVLEFIKNEEKNGCWLCENH